MVWSAFNGHMRLPLVFCKGDPDAPRKGVTSKSYLTMLKEDLPEIANSGHDIFMQDNAPIHKGGIVLSWLREQAFQVMDWPPYSPDLNPIENLWPRLKQNLRKEAPGIVELSKAQADGQLHMVLPRAWMGIDKQIFDNAIESMPRRVQAVIDAEGWYTKY